MKLLKQLLSEMGADAADAITIVPSFGVYLTSVKRVEELSPENITLEINGRTVIVTGKNLTVGRFFMGDMLIRGEVTGVKIE